MTTRRSFITLLGGAATAWPIVALAQQPDRMRRIGMLISARENNPEAQARAAALREGLQNLGWTEGKTIHIDYRWASSNAEILTNAAELVALKPELIFAAPSSAVAAVQRATRDIPVVFAQVSDPVGAGFVASLPRPAGNMTGFAMFEFGLGAKWLELLKEIAPAVESVAVLYDLANPTSTGYLPLMDAAARSYGVQIVPTLVRNGADVERALSDIARAPNGGFIPLPGPTMVREREQIVALATKLRLPHVYAFRYYPVHGALASYGVDAIDLYRGAASYVDRILKGEKPADLPVQLATKYELVINIKTAKTLGLTVPASLLTRADQVIE